MVNQATVRAKIMLSLFSLLLVTSCITVPRIDRKDSNNNKFSTDLQEWMVQKHPHVIDTTITNIVSDTQWLVHLDTATLINRVDSTFIDTMGKPYVLIYKTLTKTVTKIVHDSTRYTVVDTTQDVLLRKAINDANSKIAASGVQILELQKSGLIKLIIIICAGVLLVILAYLLFKK